MKHLSIYDIELKKTIFEYDVLTYEISNYNNDTTELEITTYDNVDFHIRLRNDNKYAISIMKAVGKQE